jgi:HlyD family secretion protein
MKRQIQLWGSRTLMVVLLLVAAQRWGLPMYKQYFSPKKTVVFVPTAKVQVGKFTVSFREIGTLDAEKSQPVYGEDDGKIIWLVSEGVLVKPGDKIAEMDTTQVTRDLRNQKLTVKNAEADVARANAELEILRLSNKTELDKQQADYDFNQNELKMANEQLDKKKRLADEKLVPRDQVIQAEGEVRSKQLAVDKGKLDLELKKKDNDSKESQKKAEVRKVEFARDTQQRNLDELQGQVKSGIISAPAAGMVVIAKTWGGPGDYRKLQSGDQLHHRQTICQLPDLSSMLVKINVGESDAPKVKLGMEALVRLEAIPDRVFHGSVKEVSSLATEGNPWETGSTPGRKNFEVTVSLKESDPKTLKPGMTADVEFICDAVAGAMSVPLESVIEKDGKTFVYVKTPKGYARTRVVTGKYNDNFVIIAKGLNMGQVIALRDPTRPMDQQEAGTSGPGAPEDKQKKAPAALPSLPSTGASKK